jgi:hypothetical protein
MLFDYLILLPSEQTFRQGQSERIERSPQFQKVVKIEEKVDSLVEDDGSE